MRIYLVGFMGSGKTTAGRQLARRLGMQFLDLDAFIESTYKTSIPLFFDKYDEKAFRLIEKESLHRTLNTDHIVISTGGGTPCFFDNMAWMNANGLTVYLKMHPKSLGVRLRNSRKTRPLIRQKTESELIAFIGQNLEYRETFYNLAALTAKGENLDVDALVNEILNFERKSISSDFMDQYRNVFNKLKIEPDTPALLANAPHDYFEELSRFNEMTVRHNKIEEAGKFGFIQLFVKQQSELEKYFPRLLQNFDGEGLYWICYPKKSGSIETDLTRDEGWKVLKKYRYRPVASVSVDDTWSAIRVRLISQVKPKEKKKIPEIDYEKREVYPPEDLTKALKDSGLLEKFGKMSFTHQREYVEAIVEAKKTETRERRILKTIEMLKKK